AYTMQLGSERRRFGRQSQGVIMKRYTHTLVATLTLAGAVTWAQDMTYDDHRPNLVSRIGMTAEAGGGVMGFVDSKAYNIANAGGLWTARVTVGTRSFIGGEAAYVGTAQPLNTLGVADNAALI